jgi:hypothetical protein
MSNSTIGITTQSAVELTTIKYDLSMDKIPYLSSDQFSSGLLSVLTLLDMAYTFGPRYFKLSDDISHVNREGYIIDYTSHHPWAAIGFTIVTGLAALYAAAKFIKDAIAENRNLHSTQATVKRLEEERKLREEQLTQDAQDDVDLLNEISEHLKKNSMNDYIKRVIDNDHYLMNKYKSVAINDNKLEVVLDKVNIKPTIKEKIVKKVKNIVGAAFDGLGNASYVYWIMWIGAGMFTGIFASGIAGIPLAVGFGIPLILGGLYTIIKSVNFFRKKRHEANTDDAQEILQSQLEANSILRRAEAEQQADIANIILNQEIKKLALKNGNDYQKTDFGQTELIDTYDEKINFIPKNKLKKGLVLASVGAAATLGSFVAVQYDSWITTDFLDKVFGVATADPTGFIAGAALMIVAVGLGMYQLYKAYKSFQATEKQLNVLSTEEDVIAKQEARENRLREKLEKIQALKVELDILAPNSENKGVADEYINKTLNNLSNSEFMQPKAKPSGWAKFKNYLYTCLDGGMTGAFIARMGVVPGTAIYLAFAAPLFLNPYAIAAIVTIAAVSYACLKMYRFYQAGLVKLAEAALLVTPERQMRNKKQEETAALCLRYLQEKKQQILANNAKADSQVKAKTQPENSCKTTVKLVVDTNTPISSTVVSRSNSSSNSPASSSRILNFNAAASNTTNTIATTASANSSTGSSITEPESEQGILKKSIRVGRQSRSGSMSV